MIGCLLPITAAIGFAAKRGVVVGVVAAVVYGALTLSLLLAWERVAAWSKRHPLLDGLIIVPLLFLAVAYCTKLSIAICVVIALVGGLFLVPLTLLRRRARRRNGLLR